MNKHLGCPISKVGTADQLAKRTYYREYMRRYFKKHPQKKKEYSKKRHDRLLKLDKIKEPFPWQRIKKEVFTYADIQAMPPEKIVELWNQGKLILATPR